MLFFRRRQKEQDRRSTRRSDAARGIESAELRWPGAAARTVTVLDSSAQGARVSCPRGGEALPLSAAVIELRVRMQGARAEQAIAARITRLEEETERTILALEFIAPQRDLAGLRDIDRIYFDRRRHPRHRLDEAVWVDLQLGRITLCGSLVDISRGGLGMRLAPCIAGSLAPGLIATVEFRLPGDFSTIRLPAELRHREDDNEGSRLGLLFIEKEEDAEIFEKIEDFLARLAQNQPG